MNGRSCKPVLKPGHRSIHNQAELNPPWVERHASYPSGSLPNRLGNAMMVELVDTAVLNSADFGRVGSSPTHGTKQASSSVG